MTPRGQLTVDYGITSAQESDEMLMVRLMDGDRAAFDALFERYAGRLRSFVYRFVGDREVAEDLAQEVFVTVFKAIDGFRGDSKLSTWIYRVASNHSKNRIKYLVRRARNAKRPLDEISDRDALESGTMATSATVARPDEMAHAKQTESMIQRALGDLDEEHRELIVLRDIQDLRYDEIQRVTGLAEGTVKSRLHRARLALQRRVAELQAGGSVKEGSS